MATVNVLDYGAQFGNEMFDNGPVFADAALAAGNNGIMIIGPGVYHLWTYPDIKAKPTLQMDPGVFLQFHLTSDFYGTPEATQLQKFVNYHDAFGAEYAWTLEGMGMVT